MAIALEKVPSGLAIVPKHDLCLNGCAYTKQGKTKPPRQSTTGISASWDEASVPAAVIWAIAPVVISKSTIHKPSRVCLVAIISALSAIDCVSTRHRGYYQFWHSSVRSHPHSRKSDSRRRTSRNHRQKSRWLLHTKRRARCYNACRNSWTGLRRLRGKGAIHRVLVK